MSHISQLFNCKRCGYCCRGETTVSLDENDQKQMVEVLNQSFEQVGERFWRITAGCVQMKTVDGHCIFYKEGCSVHKGRPWRCAQWPLHPSILIDENNLKTISDSCPGINKKISYRKFCEILEELMRESTVSC